MKNTYLFSVRKELLKSMTMSRVLLGLLLVFLAYNWIHDVFNPTDQNRLLIVDRSEQAFESPCTLFLNGEVSWEKRVDQIGSRRAASNGSVHIINIQRAWFYGDIVLKDATGRILANAEIRPIGRYCGTLVMVLLPDGESQVAFNRLPDSQKE